MKNLKVSFNEEKECNDVHCPIHGKQNIRRRFLEGVIVHHKSKNTAKFERDYFLYIPKYERYERRKTKLIVHVPDCIKVKEGDEVIIAETTKISKTKSWVVIRNKTTGEGIVLD